MKVIYESICKSIAAVIDKAERSRLRIDRIELTPDEFATFKQEMRPDRAHLANLAWTYMGIPVTEAKPATPTTRYGGLPG